MLFVLSLIGAIGLTARGASKNGKGLCGDLADTRPESCAEAAVAITFTWITVMFGAPSASLVLYSVGLTIR